MQAFSNAHNQAQYKRKILLGISLVPLVFISTYAISSYFSFSEYFNQWAKNYEEVAEVDELPIALLTSLLAMVWFATQRIAESRELIKRNHELLHRVLEIQESERKSIALNLHDDLGQYLNAIKAEATSLCMDTQITVDAIATAKRITTNADHAYKSTRLLMHSLRPVALDELGLSSAIEHLVDQWAIAMQKTTQFILTINGEINNQSEHINIAIYRIVQEALTNITKHAQATEVKVSVSNHAQHLLIEISDNGIGFNANNMNSGYGLLGMSERAEAIGCPLVINSNPFEGTHIFANIPIIELSTPMNRQDKS